MFLLKLLALKIVVLDDANNRNLKDIPTYFQQVVFDKHLQLKIMDHHI